MVYVKNPRQQQLGGLELAKPNYQFKKRQKELARKEKKELKRHRKMDRETDGSETPPDQTQVPNSPEETL